MSTLPSWNFNIARAVISPRVELDLFVRRVFVCRPHNVVELVPGVFSIFHWQTIEHGLSKKISDLNGFLRRGVYRGSFSRGRSESTLVQILDSSIDRARDQIRKLDRYSRWNWRFWFAFSCDRLLDTAQPRLFKKGSSGSTLDI